MEVPIERLTISSTHSGGPGGQNVNKVATRVEVRFVLDDADWLSARARRRLRELFPGRVNRRGELVLTSSRHRTRQRNLEDCLEKLGELIREASRRPKRRVPTRPTRASRQRRLDTKRKRGEIKRARRKPGAED